jgi:hypothetical protein
VVSIRGEKPRKEKKEGREGGRLTHGTKILLLATGRVPSLLDGDEVGPVSAGVSATSSSDLGGGDAGDLTFEGHKVSVDSLLEMGWVEKQGSSIERSAQFRI